MWFVHCAQLVATQLSRSNKCVYENHHLIFKCAVDGHYRPTLQCTKEVEALRTAGKC